MDDANRFARPIVSIRLFSDSRLCFGAKYFFQHDAAFYVPMARGAVTVMEKDGFAADHITHSIRPVDMTGKSAVIITTRLIFLSHQL